MNKIYILFSALTCVLITSCSNSRNDKSNIYVSTEAIIINQNAGEYENTIALVLDSTLLPSKKHSKYLNEYLFGADDYTVSKGTITKSGLNYLEEFIVANCNDVYPNEDDLAEGFDFYFVKVFRDTGVQDCYYYSKDLDTVQHYFKDMKSWIEKSAYKDDFIQLLEYLETHIQSLENKRIVGVVYQS